MSTGITFANSSGSKQNISYSGTDIIPIISAYNGAAKTLGYISTCSYSVHTNFSPVNTCGHFNPISFTRGTRLIAGSFVSIVFDKTPLYELNTTAYNTYNSPTSGHLPPFDIILIFHNEYQQYKECVLKIFGVRIMDEGQVHSVDDIYTENTMSFVAEDIQLLSDNGYTKTSPDIDSSYFKKQNVDYKFSSISKYATDRTYVGIAKGFNQNKENYTVYGLESKIKAEIDKNYIEEKIKAEIDKNYNKSETEKKIQKEMQDLKDQRKQVTDEILKIMSGLDNEFLNKDYMKTSIDNIYKKIQESSIYPEVEKTNPMSFVYNNNEYISPLEKQVRDIVMNHMPNEEAKQLAQEAFNVNNERLKQTAEELRNKNFNNEIMNNLKIKKF